MLMITMVIMRMAMMMTWSSIGVGWAASRLVLCFCGVINENIDGHGHGQHGHHGYSYMNMMMMVNLITLELGGKLLELLGARAFVQLRLEKIMIFDDHDHDGSDHMMVKMTWRANDARASSFCRTFGPTIRSKPYHDHVMINIYIDIIIKGPSIGSNQEPLFIVNHHNHLLKPDCSCRILPETF